jgi:hypothetical protein
VRLDEEEAHQIKFAVGRLEATLAEGLRVSMSQVADDAQRAAVQRFPWVVTYFTKK